MKLKNLAILSGVVTALTAIICVQAIYCQKNTKRDSTERPNSVQSGSATIMISQVDGGGGGSTGTYLNDYVELKNISSSPQSLNGLSLMYGSASGQFASSASNAFALPNVTIQPGQYYLVQLGATGTAGAALPVTPDASSTNLSMSASSGKVALVTSSFTANSCGATATPCTLPNPNIIDLVSWGAANDAEGGAPTNGGTALNSSLGNVRKGSGCTDTDNNNADFDIVTAPVPRNTNSTLSTCFTGAPQHASLDFDGDNKTDFAITRSDNGKKDWWISLNAGGFMANQFGLDSDQPAPADYDGDGKTDVAVWRNGPANQAAFYILRSMTNTMRVELFGQDGDDPKTVRDYDGDGKADVSVYRPGANPGDQSYFFYRGSLNNPSGNITYVPWGTTGDVETQGDFDGDGKGDFCVRRDIGGAGWFFLLKSSGGVEYINWGLPGDGIVPCDFDGDGRSDLCVARVDANSNYNTYVLTRSGGGTGASPIVFGNASLNDKAAFGDFDGDGRTDVGIWRPNADPSQDLFWIRLTATGNLMVRQWGLPGDRSLAEWNTTGGQ